MRSVAADSSTETAGELAEAFLEYFFSPMKSPDSATPTFPFSVCTERCSLSPLSLPPFLFMLPTDAHSRGLENNWSLRSPPTYGILWFYTDQLWQGMEWPAWPLDLLRQCGTLEQLSNFPYQWSPDLNDAQDFQSAAHTELRRVFTKSCFLQEERPLKSTTSISDFTLKLILFVTIYISGYYPEKASIKFCSSVSQLWAKTLFYYQCNYFSWRVIFVAEDVNKTPANGRGK